MKNDKKKIANSIVVVAMLGGLGSQMFKYAFYLSIKMNMKHAICYIDTTPFYIMKMWNGYELHSIFNIVAPDISQYYTDHEKEELHHYSQGYFNYALSKISKIKINSKKIYRINRGKVEFWLDITKDNNLLKRILIRVKNKIYYCRNKKNGFNDKYPVYCLKLKNNLYFDEFNHNSDRYFKDVKEQILSTFIFPQFEDSNNINMMKKINFSNSVAIHIRRSDHLYDNSELFKKGYFKISIDFILSKVQDASFFIFSDDITWCKDNEESLGLVDKKVYYVDWNKGDQSYRDMQLMTYCKHNILAISAFSWWGYYLSTYKEKIVCAPKGYWLEVENHF